MGEEVHNILAGGVDIVIIGKITSYDHLANYTTHARTIACTNVTADSSKDSCTVLLDEHQTFANFAMVDQFATIKSAKPKIITSKYTRSLPERNS